MSVETAESAFAEGNAAHVNEDYEKASQCYDTCIELGVCTRAINFNLINEHQILYIIFLIV